MDDAGTPLAAEEAFDALGDETRVAILRAFDPPVGEPLSFSALRERVGMRDSGKFNYHLDRLVGRFVRKTEAGYELTTTGVRIHGALLSGAYTGSEAFEPLTLTDERDGCPLCDGDLQLRYVEDRLSVECVACGEWESTTTVPPSMLEGRDRETLPAVFSHDLRTTMDQVVSGFCPLCTGPTTGAYERLDLADERTDGVDEGGRDDDGDRDAEVDGVDGADEVDTAGTDDESVLLVRYECERCANPVTATVGAVLLAHPAVVSFYHDHGVDVRNVPIWRLSLVHPEAATVVDHDGEGDPTRVRVTVERDGERLSIVLDEDLSVVETERTAV